MEGHIYSPQDLLDMRWDRFETLVVDTIRQLYGQYQISTEQTSLSHDGGRDAESHHVLAIGLGEDLSVSVRVFLEVKKRSTENVGKGDIGSHLIDAFANKVTKIIFVTNSDFSENLPLWIGAFCAPLNIQFSLINGVRLIKLLNNEIGNPQVPDRTVDDQIIGKVTFSLSPTDALPSSAKCMVRPDRPVFAIIDVAIGEDVAPFYAKLSMRLIDEDAASIFGINDTQSQPILLSPGTRRRWVFAIWPGLAGHWDGCDFNIDQEGFPSPLRLSVINSFQVSEIGLQPMMVGGQKTAYKQIQSALNTWRNTGGSALRILLSPGGLGKSFLIGCLRRDIQSWGIRTLMLDGEAIESDTALITASFTTLFPFARNSFEPGLKPALLRWLECLDLSPQLRRLVADDLCDSGRLRADNYNPAIRAQLLAALLAEAGAARGLVFIFEDLHKVPPSVLSLLADTLRQLRSTGMGNIFLLLTSRPFSDSGTHDLARDWLQRLQKISALAEDALLHLRPLQDDEARQLLRSTVPTLSEAQTESIIQQVGTSPFNLREAVLYLKLLGLLGYVGTGQTPVLLRPDKLNALLGHDGLKTTTQKRLQVFFKNQPSWLQKMVEAGACYGRQFPFRETAAVALMPDSEDALDALDECARWSIVLPVPGCAELIEFDHDLVRAALLSGLAPHKHQRLASGLLAELEADADALLLSSLAYQAGQAEKAFTFARTAAKAGSERGRPADALRANYIALLTLDPAWASQNEGDDSWIDLAIQVAAPARRDFDNWQARDREALAILLDNLQSLGSVSSGSGRLSDAILSEARMVAERLQDHGCIAALTAMQGRMLFEQNDVAKALAHHEEAERIFNEQGLMRNIERAENLIRLAICLRQNGRTEDSLNALGQAISHRPKAAWSLLNKVRSNLGAIYLRSDWTVVRYHWERQLRSARVHGLLSRQAHALASLSFINLFDGRLAEGRRQAEESLLIARRHEMENTALRCDLNLSVAWLMEGNAEAALQCLGEAEAIALRHNVGRRLWRVYANLATTWEILGDDAKAVAHDIQTLTCLDATNWEADRIARHGRELLPLINLASRTLANPDTYGAALALMNPACRDGLLLLAQNLEDGQATVLSPVNLKYRVPIYGRHRFLITE
ncbi:MAG: restriction endonuclease [Magnetospirillum sp. WYHS-4]